MVGEASARCLGKCRSLGLESEENMFINRMVQWSDLHLNHALGRRDVPLLPGLPGLDARIGVGAAMGDTKRAARRGARLRNTLLCEL